MKPYEIWITGYYHMSGGIRALHALKQELLNRDISVSMKYENKRQDGCIGVYPEIVSDNPENYENYTRWLLNVADFPISDTIFAWENGMGDYPLLTVNVIEKNLWIPYNGPRSGVGYWVGKGIKKEELIPDGAIEISRSNFTKRSELAEKIRTLEYLISFDGFSIINAEAAISGTPVLIHTDKKSFYKKELSQENWIPYGVAWDINEMDQARQEVYLAYDHYQSLLPIFDKRIDNFIEITQKKFS
jgi:hypothetical protein